MSLPSMLPVRHSRLALIGLVCLTSLIVLGLAQTGTGAAALSLFQSPSSPIAGEAQPTAAPVVSADAQAGQPATSSGLSVPTWAIVVVAVVVVLAVIVVFALVRRARR